LTTVKGRSRDARLRTAASSSPPANCSIIDCARSMFPLAGTATGRPKGVGTSATASGSKSMSTSPTR
jgi:hypothetical protein